MRQLLYVTVFNRECSEINVRTFGQRSISDFSIVERYKFCAPITFHVSRR